MLVGRAYASNYEPKKLKTLSKHLMEPKEVHSNLKALITSSYGSPEGLYNLANSQLESQDWEAKFPIFQPVMKGKGHINNH